MKDQGFEHGNVLNLQRLLLNRYKPKVAVLHDFDGEYGHGAHMLNTATFIEAVENPTDGLYLPEKIYVHLYKENPLTLDIDSPLDAFGGKTAFQVSQEAFGFHKSQHWTWFYNWIYGKTGNITKASQIKSYNPANYGLYYTTVGEDSGIGDMLEHVKTYAEVRAEEEAGAPSPASGRRSPKAIGKGTGRGGRGTSGSGGARSRAACRRRTRKESKPHGLGFQSHRSSRFGSYLIPLYPAEAAAPVNS